MKQLFRFSFILFILVNFLINGQDYSITENINSGLFYLNGEVQTGATIFHELVVVAIYSCSYSQSELPGWFNQNYTKVHDFFDAATFGNFNYAINWLTKDVTHAFIMPRSNIPKFDGSCEHVHSQANILAVLAQADTIYDFNNYDFDNDGIVDIHFTSINIIGSHNGGVTNYPGSYCFSYITNDVNTIGNHIIIHVNRQTRGFNESSYFGVFFHESGHSLFSFPDMDHAGIYSFNHYGIGGFDVMSGGGFQGVPSLYNPWFRHSRNWYTPTPITSNGEKTLQDFQTSGQCYIYNPTSLPINSISNEKFYISYHKPSPSNYFYNTWPYKDRNLGGVLIWHVKKDNPNIYDSYYDYRKLDIDIEAAHGKYIWQEYSDRVTNTGVANALVGRDSLEIRKIAGGIEIQGPYYLKDKGSSSIFYTPNDGNNFTFYSNPNSNWYVNSSAENYAQNILSGFSMKNLRDDNGTIKADFYIDNFTIIQNTTLAIGKWYINNSITVSPNVTLTIQPGTILSFSNGASLIVNGTLTAIGNSSNKITFDRSGTTGTWGSIIFDGSAASGSVLDNVEIKYASDVRCLSQANVTIKNSLFDNCINGIYVYNSAPIIKFNNINEPQQNGIYGETGGYQPNIQDNVIKKTSNNSGYHNYQGIWFYSNSSVYANHNDVSGFFWGAYIGGGSYASFYYSSKGLYPYNRFTNNLYGIAAGWGVNDNSKLDCWRWW